MSSDTLKEAFYQFQVHCFFVLDEHLFQELKEKLFNVCARLEIGNTTQKKMLRSLTCQLWVPMLYIVGCFFVLDNAGVN